MIPKFKIFLLCFCSFVLNACGNNDLIMKSYICTAEDKAPVNYIEHKFTVKNNQVFHTATDFNEGKQGKSSIRQLEDCTVIDSKNWQCGGVNYTGVLSGLGKSERFQVVNGQFTYQPGGEPNLPPATGCDSFLQWKKS